MIHNGQKDSATQSVAYPRTAQEHRGNDDRSNAK